MKTRTNHLRAAQRRAFSFLEMLLVAAVLGIVAVTALPAMSNARSASIASFADRVALELTQARARAMAEGVPHGIWISSTELQSHTIEASGSPVEAALSAMGTPCEPVYVRDYSGASVRSGVGGDGFPSFPLTIWFGVDGQPQMRDASGVLTGSFTANAQINFTRAGTTTITHRVTIHRITGFVEVTTP